MRSIAKNLYSHRYNLVLAFIILGAFIVRIINLNYNSPFNDEAIYIVIGRMGLFENDFYTYNARSWMAGVPYIYPVITSLAYYMGNIVGSRLLNIIFGVLIIEQIYIFTKSLRLFNTHTNIVAGIIASVIVGFAGVGIYTSRLATYDILSFLLFFLGINSYIKAVHHNSSKYYFLAALGLMLAFYTKLIIGVYLPFLLMLSFFINLKTTTNYWRIYFFGTFIVLAAIYIVFNYDGVYVFLHDNVANEYTSAQNILGVITKNTATIWMTGVLSAVVLMARKKRIPVLVLGAFAVLIPGIHFAIHRVATIEKHLYLSVLFLSPLIGYAMASMLTLKSKLNYITTPILILALGFYSLQYRAITKQLEQEWVDTTSLDAFLRKHVQPNDRVLTEIGASTILALYDKTFPTNITTFDWIDYYGDTSKDAYLSSIRDGFYDYIEIDGTFRDVENLRKQIIEATSQNNYSIVFTEGNIVLYAKAR